MGKSTVNGPFSMAMLVYQRVIVLRDPAVPSERKWDWGIMYYSLEGDLYLLRQWPWIQRECNRWLICDSYVSVILVSDILSGYIISLTYL